MARNQEGKNVGKWMEYYMFSDTYMRRMQPKKKKNYVL